MLYVAPDDCAMNFTSGGLEETTESSLGKSARPSLTAAANGGSAGSSATNQRYLSCQAGLYSVPDLQNLSLRSFSGCTSLITTYFIMPVPGGTIPGQASEVYPP